MQPNNEREEWLTLTQVCAMLNISKFTLYKMRQKKVFTDFYPWGVPEESGPGGGRKLVRIAKSEVESVMARGKL